MYKNKKTARVGVLVAALILSLMTLCLTDSTAIAYSPDIKVESHWGGPWYAPGEYQYITILLDADHCTAGYVTSELVSYVTSYIPWVGSLISYQFSQTADEIQKKNKGYGVKVVLKLPVIAIGVPIATNEVTSRPPPTVNDPPMLSGMTIYKWDGREMVTKGGPAVVNVLPPKSGSLAWLIGDINLDGKTEIIQPYNIGKGIGMNVYGWDGSRMTKIMGSSSNSMNDVTGSLAWLVGKINKDGTAKIIQPFQDSKGRLGLHLYAVGLQNYSGNIYPLERGLAGGGGTTKPGPPRALAWLVADLDGGGKAEIIQLYQNGDRLGMIVYSDYTNFGGTAVVPKWGTDNMGRVGALTWLVGDIDGDGKAEIIQPYQDGNRLGMNVYGWDGSKMVTKFGASELAPDMRSGATTWLVGDIDGDGKAEIIRLYKNGDSLGMIVYGWNGKIMVHKTGVSNMGLSSQSIAWLIGDIDGDGKAEIIQPYQDGKGLGMNVYGAKGNTMVLKTRGYMGQQKTDHLSWRIADVDGDGKAEIVQIWSDLASGASNYQKRILEVPTTFVNETDGTWFMADYDRDRIPDLFFIKTSNTPSNHVEVHIASGASNYQKRILEVPTTFVNETDGPWFMADYDRDGIPDLVFIKTKNTPSNHVEVHIAR